MKTSCLSILTIGHSSHSSSTFLALLRSAKAEVLADVRSRPQSRFCPQFNRVSLASSLATAKIGYVFMGEALGGRPSDSSVQRDGLPDYELMAAAPSFLRAVTELLDLAGRRRVALLCSEHEPLECHRCILIGRHLAGLDVHVRHILRDGSIEDHRKTEDRLLAYQRMDDPDLLESRDARLAEAYRLQSQHMKYRPPKGPR